MITIEQVKDYQEQPLETSVAEVIHSILGRIRVRILWLPDYPALQQRLETAIASLAWVTEVQLNPTTNSVTVYYQSQKIAPENFQQSLLRLIQQVTPMTAKTPLPSVNAFPLENKLQEVGGRMIGSSVGKIVGIGMGGITGGLLLGPLGLITGGGIGSIVGQMVGGQLGRDLVRDEKQEEINPKEEIDLQSQLQNTLERGGSEIIAETIGGVFGGIIGSATLGVPGLMFGRIIGGAIGSQLSDDLWFAKAQKNLK